MLVPHRGEVEIIQLWVNLPAKLKMVQPNYQGFQKEAIPTFTDQDGHVKVNVMAGQYKGFTGPIQSLTGVSAYTIELVKGGKVHFEEKSDRNVLLYQLNGQSNVNGTQTGDATMLVFDQDGESVHIEALTDGLLLLVSGNPIDEPMKSWGPYVMNTQTEIMEAMRDYQMGKMGILID